MKECKTRMLTELLNAKRVLEKQRKESGEIVEFPLSHCPLKASLIFKINKSVESLHLKLGEYPYFQLSVSADLTEFVFNEVLGEKK